MLARQALGGLRVGDLMTRDPVTVALRHTLGRFMDEVAWQRRHTTYPVTADGVVRGLLAFRSVAAVPRAEWDERRVDDCMIPAERVLELTPDKPRSTRSASSARARCSARSCWTAARSSASSRSPTSPARCRSGREPVGTDGRRGGTDVATRFA